jgi:hypothetical protein
MFLQITRAVAAIKVQVAPRRDINLEPRLARLNDKTSPTHAAGDCCSVARHSQIEHWVRQ